MRPITALAIALVLAACGGAVAPGGDAEAETEEPPPDVAPAAVESECSDQLGDLIAALEELDGRLDVGLNFQTYSEKVGDASVAYRRVDFEDLGANCSERVGLPAEEALNAYIRANNTWNDCIQDVDCDTDSITADLQEEWGDATVKIDDALEALEE